MSPEHPDLLGNPNKLEAEVFAAQTQWLREMYSGRPRQKIERGLDVAETIVFDESYRVAAYLESDQYKKQRKRLEQFLAENVRVAEIICIDGRLVPWTRMLARVTSAFSTPAGILDGKQKYDGEVLPGSETLNRSIRNSTNAGDHVIEFAGVHTSLHHNRDVEHPKGCGKLNADLRSGPLEIHPSQFRDGAVAFDLARGERISTYDMLDNAGAIVIPRIIDTDSQGLIYIGDSVMDDITEPGINYYETESVSLGGIVVRHNQRRVFSTKLILTNEPELPDYLRQSEYKSGSVKLDFVEDLPKTIERIVDLTEHLMQTEFTEDWTDRFRSMYDERNLPEEVIQALVVYAAYNVSTLWLSGYHDDEKVPHRFSNHGERFAAAGDKTPADFWIEHSPFIVSGSETEEVVEENLDVAFSLLPGILEKTHGVDLDEEAMLLIVAGSLDPDSDPETQRRAEVSLAERYFQKVQHLEKTGRLRSGEIVALPVLVHQKTRKPIRIPDFSDHYAAR